MTRAQVTKAVVVLTLACAGCGQDESTTGNETGAGSSESGEAPSGDAMDESSAPPVTGFCALPCDDEADCAEAAGDAPADWVCTAVGLEGVCERASATPPVCDPQMCPAGTAALCQPSLGPTICVPLCQSDADCTAPSSCGGMLEDGSTFCTASRDVGCSPGGCTCSLDADCPAPATFCGPSEG